MKYINIYELGKKAKAGDEKAMLKIIELKKACIIKRCKGNEDCYQAVIEKLITGVKKYNFKV